eukprot:356552-Chlamydomonas_euryale.AAC.5
MAYGACRRVPPSGMPHTVPPACLSQPAMMSPACSMSLFPYDMFIARRAAVCTWISSSASAWCCMMSAARGTGCAGESRGWSEEERGLRRAFYWTYPPPMPTPSAA